MKLLQIQLPSGSWRYITSIIIGHDFSHSIYPSDAIEGSDKNLQFAKEISKKHKIDHLVSFRILDKSHV